MSRHTCPRVHLRARSSAESEVLGDQRPLLQLFMLLRRHAIRAATIFPFRLTSKLLLSLILPQGLDQCRARDGR